MIHKRAKAHGHVQPPSGPWGRQLRKALLVVSLVPSMVMAAPAPEDIVQKSLNALYAAGTDQRSVVRMDLVNAQGDVRQRNLTMLRKNTGTAGEQRYYIYFHSPADVKGTAFLIAKHPAREDDRWLFIPAVRMVKRIAADDKRSSFVGSDFTYEDVSGRDVEDETHTLLREDTLDGRPVYVLESRPKNIIDYSRRVAWIDQERWLPLKEEFYDVQDQLVRVFTAEKIEKVDEIWTVTERSMENQLTGHRTEVEYTKVSYNEGLQDNLFSERYLRNPPRQWIR